MSDIMRPMPFAQLMDWILSEYAEQGSIFGESRIVKKRTGHARPIFDEKIETPGGTLYVDGGSILYLIGSTMDWVEDDFTAGFVFNNPNAKGACGCGESFTV